MNKDNANVYIVRKYTKIPKIMGAVKVYSLKAPFLGCSRESSRLPVPAKLLEGNFELLKYRENIKLEN